MKNENDPNIKKPCIGISSASFYPDVYTEDSIKLMKKINFDLGEVFLNSTSEYEEKFIEKLKIEREKNNFFINSLHAFSSSFEPYLFDSYLRRKKDMLIPFTKICKAAKKLGCSCYTFHGLRLGKIDKDSVKSIIEVYNELICIALDEGIKIAQENVSWCMSSNLNFLKLLIEKCKYPIYFTLDIKQAYKASINPEEYIEIMKDRLINLHINDVDYKNPCLLPGKGNVDYIEIYKKLQKINYQGPFIIEVYKNNYKNYHQLSESKKYLETIFSKNL